MNSTPTVCVFVAVTHVHVFIRRRDRDDRLVLRQCRGELYTCAVKRCRRMTRRNRLQLTLLAVLALVCQQVAFAAYVCPVAAMPATDAAMSADCHALPTVAPTPGAQHATTLCLLHCGQQVTVANNVQLPSVPPLLLPAVLPAPLAISILPATRATHARDAAARTPGLPPPLRHRVLLI